MKSNKIIAIDPGTRESAYVLYEEGTPPRDMDLGILPNRELVDLLATLGAATSTRPATLVIEAVESFGMPVGRDVFETCIWTGRFIQAYGGEYALVGRRHIKLWLCNDARAKDANIRKVLLDRFGPAGTKKDPGATYGVKTHLWSALALACTYADTADLRRKGMLGEHPARLLLADEDDHQAPNVDAPHGSERARAQGRRNRRTARK